MGFTEYVKGKGKYTEEEEEMGRAFCKAINGDKELKHFFVEFVYGTLRDCALEVDKAFNKSDRKRGEEVINEAINKVRAITTYMHVKVLTKEREV